MWKSGEINKRETKFLSDFADNEDFEIAYHNSLVIISKDSGEYFFWLVEKRKTKYHSTISLYYWNVLSLGGMIIILLFVLYLIQISMSAT